MSDGPFFIEDIDYEAALSWFMENDDGTEAALVNAIDAALVGKREALVEVAPQTWRAGVPDWVARLVTGEEVEE